MIIGSHVSMSGKDMLLASVKEALGYQASAFMVYTGAPQNTRRKAIEDMKIEEAHDLMKEHGLDQKHIVVHAPYIMNFSNKDSNKRAFAVDFFTEEVKRAAAMGAGQIVLHPGAHVSLGADLAIQYIVEGLNEVIERTKELQVLIALETMAGKGTEIGRNFDELKAIIEGVNDSSRLSVCFDTCHTHDAGYSVKEDFDAVMREFDQKIGTDKISVFHINDSKNVCGASKDRHENIGFGYIGYEALHYIVHHSDFQDIPKILETPYITECDDSTKKVFPPYKEEIEMLQNHTFNPDIKSVIRKRNQK